jgi:hypothetical protein
MKGSFKFLFVVFVLVLWVALPVYSAVAASPGAPLPPETTVFIQSLLTRGGWLFLVIFLDLILGVTVALKQHIFKWSKLADFLADYAPKVIAWIGLELLGLLPPDLKIVAGIGDALGVGAYALILLSAAASILGHVQAIGVLPISIPGILPTDKGKQ